MVWVKNLHRRNGVPKPEKIAAVEEIKEKLDSAKVAILTEFQGLNVAEITD